MAKVLYAPLVVCDCGARTLLEPWTAGADYDFICRDCSEHNKGDIPSPGAVGVEYDALRDGSSSTPQQGE